MLSVLLRLTVILVSSSCAKIQAKNLKSDSSAQETRSFRTYYGDYSGSRGFDFTRPDDFSDIHYPTYKRQFYGNVQKNKGYDYRSPPQRYTTTFHHDYSVPLWLPSYHYEGPVGRKASSDFDDDFGTSFRSRDGVNQRKSNLGQRIKSTPKNNKAKDTDRSFPDDEGKKGVYNSYFTRHYQYEQKFDDPHSSGWTYDEGPSYDPSHSSNIPDAEAEVYFDIMKNAHYSDDDCEEGKIDDSTKGFTGKFFYCSYNDHDNEGFHGADSRDVHLDLLTLGENLF